MFKSPVKKRMLAVEEGKRIIIYQHRSFYRNPEAQVGFKFGKDGQKNLTSRFEFREVSVLPGKQDIYLSARGMNGLALKKTDEWEELIPNENIVINEDPNSFSFYRLDINKDKSLEMAFYPGKITK